jgi:hypothetical protein
MNAWYNFNRNAIEDAGLAAAVQVSSWAIITSINTKFNTAVSTDGTAATGWGYIHPPALIANGENTGGDDNGSLTTTGTNAPDNATMFACLPVNWKDWTSLATGDSMDDIVIWA